MIELEVKFKAEGNYLGKCHEWIGAAPPPGFMPGYSAMHECWWVRLRCPREGTFNGRRVYGGRWIIAGFDRDEVDAAARVRLAQGFTVWVDVDSVAIDQIE